MIYSNKLSKAGLASPAVATGSVMYLNQTQDSQMRSKFSKERSRRLSVGRSEVYSDKELKMKGHAKKSSVVEAYSTIKTASQQVNSKTDESNEENKMEIVLFEQD